jgi:hypothetical protein
MTCYHISGSLFLKFPNVVSYNTFKTLVNSLATPANAVLNDRNADIDNLATLSLALGTYHLELSLRFQTQTQLNNAVSQLTTTANKYYDPTVYSTLEWHTCHHDEPAGAPPIENQTVQNYGIPSTS